MSKSRLPRKLKKKLKKNSEITFLSTVIDLGPIPSFAQPVPSCLPLLCNPFFKDEDLNILKVNKVLPLEYEYRSVWSKD